MLMPGAPLATRGLVFPVPHARGGQRRACRTGAGLRARRLGPGQGGAGAAEVRPRLPGRGHLRVPARQSRVLGQVSSDTPARGAENG